MSCKQKHGQKVTQPMNSILRGEKHCKKIEQKRSRSTSDVKRLLFEIRSKFTILQRYYLSSAPSKVRPFSSGLPFVRLLSKQIPQRFR